MESFAMSGSGFFVHSLHHLYLNRLLSKPPMPQSRYGDEIKLQEQREEQFLKAFNFKTAEELDVFLNETLNAQVLDKKIAHALDTITAARVPGQPTSAAKIAEIVAATTQTLETIKTVARSASLEESITNAATMKSALTSIAKLEQSVRTGTIGEDLVMGAINNILPLLHENGKMLGMQMLLSQLAPVAVVPAEGGKAAADFIIKPESLKMTFGVSAKATTKKRFVATLLSSNLRNIFNVAAQANNDVASAEFVRFVMINNRRFATVSWPWNVQPIFGADINNLKKGPQVSVETSYVREWLQQALTFYIGKEMIGLPSPHLDAVRPGSAKEFRHVDFLAIGKKIVRKSTILKKAISDGKKAALKFNYEIASAYDHTAWYDFDLAIRTSLKDSNTTFAEVGESGVYPANAHSLASHQAITFWDAMKTARIVISGIV